ncbi:amidohydrolase family protein [Petroclostridium sp. X23]|uniref:amidohydrolase family protein n=1 Tax=Petroclostridium sp. X23 TaxID=3045146 RepID=UPI0024ACCB9F|nr:amidohydrolase family protein [Petroclostridium sp. X23]WHH60356.1 amidohydrolase family protein [Petroclostridium sp. X23]
MMGYIGLCADTVLVGGHLKAIQNGCILIKDGKILKVLAEEAFLKEDVKSCEIIELGNVTLMPGMIECHNHVALDARVPDHLEMMNDSECELTIRSMKTLKDDLMSGVTTARCMGDRHYIDVVFKHQIQKGDVIGPNLLVSGIGMRSVHGHGYVGMGHAGVEEFRRTARENMAKGVDLLKVFVTPGMPSVNSSFIPHFLTVDEIKTVVEEGKSMDLKTAAHCIGGQGLKDCIEAGVDVIEHAYAATEDDIELIEKNNRWVNLTSGIFMDPSREAFCSKQSVLTIRKLRESTIRCLEKVVKSNVRFTLGTDAYHTFLYREVEYAVSLGADKLTSLKGVTVNAAEMCGISDRTGSISEGLDADIIAVKGDPLEDVSVLANVSFVMKNGHIYKR